MYASVNIQPICSLVMFKGRVKSFPYTSAHRFADDAA